MPLSRVAISPYFTSHFLALCFALIAALFVVPSYALAKDKLPLRRGVFVQVGEPCVDPANFAILRYDGKSCSPGHDNCEILSVAKKGKAFVTKEICAAVQTSKAGPPSTSIYLIEDRASFKVAHDGLEKLQAYRWCAATMEIVYPDGQ
jgi:hypothetical protein